MLSAYRSLCLSISPSFHSSFYFLSLPIFRSYSSRTVYLSRMIESIDDDFGFDTFPQFSLVPRELLHFVSTFDLNGSSDYHSGKRITFRGHRISRFAKSKIII